MNSERDMKIETLNRYIEFMQLALPSQKLLNNLLLDMIPGIKWREFNKTDVAIDYALDLNVKAEHFEKILEIFGFKRIKYDFSRSMKRLNIQLEEKIN